MICCHYLIVFLVSPLILEVDLFELRCPENVQRHLRVKSFCKNSSHDLYSCLFDENNNAFNESCTNKTDFVRPGQKYVIRDFPTNAECSSLTYQPIKFWLHKYSICIFLKSQCNEIGQILYANRSTTVDNTCRCDHNDGYAFLVQPLHTYYCIPTEEDCTCFKKKCPKNTNLSTDYNCVSILNSTEVLPCRECANMTIARNTSTSDQFHNNSMETIAPTLTVTTHLILIVLITVGTTICLTVSFSIYILMMETRFEFSEKKTGAQSIEMNASIKTSIDFKCYSSAKSIKVQIYKTRLKDSDVIKFFMIKYTESVLKKSKKIRIPMEYDNIEIEGLTPGTMYAISLYWCDECGIKRRLSEDITVNTKNSNTDFLKTKSFPPESRNSDLFILTHVRKENRVKTSDEVKEIDIICEYVPNEEFSNEKTVLMIGAAESGKSTLINALINYLAEVSYNDRHRFGLIKEKTKEEKKLSTEMSTFVVYRIPNNIGYKVKCKLNIITTHDCHQKIATRIDDLCQNLKTHLDAILIVVSSTIKLTAKQRYDYSNIAAAKPDMNVFVVITFCDKRNTDECLKQLDEAKVHYTHVFEFENDNILRSCSNSRLFSKDEKRWEKRRNTFNELFRKLNTTKN